MKKRAGKEADWRMPVGQRGQRTLCRGLDGTRRSPAVQTADVLAPGARGCTPRHVSFLPT